MAENKKTRCARKVWGIRAPRRSIAPRRVYQCYPVFLLSGMFLSDRRGSSCCMQIVGWQALAVTTITIVNSLSVRLLNTVAAAAHRNETQRTGDAHASTHTCNYSFVHLDVDGCGLKLCGGRPGSDDQAHGRAGGVRARHQALR